MSSSSEVFSDISSYENHLQLPIKVNVSKKITEQSLDVQHVRKSSEIVSNPIDNTTKTLGLKLQSNTTSKIRHALEVLKKFDNKYKIKSSELPIVTKLVDSSNSSTNISVESKRIKIQELWPPSHQPRPRSTQALEDIKLDPPYEDKHSNDTISHGKISKDIVAPHTTVDESEDYESDFESSDDESLSVESNVAKDVDSSCKSQPRPSARPRSALTKPSLHSSDTESSIHTIADEGSNSIENVGTFGNVRLFTFSDFGPNAVKKIDELTVPVHLKDGSVIPKTGARPIALEKSIDESIQINSLRTLEIPIPSHVITVEKLNRPTSLNKSSDVESISECLSNSGESDETSVGPFRRNIFTMDDLNGADSGHHRQVPLVVQGEVETKLNGAKGYYDVAGVTGRLSTLEGEIEEINEDESVLQKTGEHFSTNRNSTVDNSYESDTFSDESEVKPKNGSSEESLSLSGEIKSGLVSELESGRPKSSRKQIHSQTTKTRPTTSVDKHSRNVLTLQSHRKTSSAKGRRTGEATRPTKLLLTTRDVSVQTEFAETDDGYAENVRESRGPKARPPRPVFEALNLSWDFEDETCNERSTFNFQRQTLTPEVIEALANHDSAEDALDQVLKHQISLTRNFMASQYKMYQTYCMSVKQITDQYTPVTLEETKEYIRRHKRMRPNGNYQQVIN